MFLLNCITSFLGPSGHFPSFQERFCSKKVHRARKPQAEVRGRRTHSLAGALGHFFPPSPPGGERLTERVGHRPDFAAEKSPRPCISGREVRDACQTASRCPVQGPAQPGAWRAARRGVATPGSAGTPPGNCTNTRPAPRKGVFAPGAAGGPGEGAKGEA